MLRSKTKQAIRKCFGRALLDLQDRSGWNAKQMAANYHLPYRSVANWVAGKTVPAPRRLRELCRTFGWQYELLFQREALEDEESQSQHMDLQTLSQWYLRRHPQDPLEAWSYVSVAGALVFNALSGFGFECRARIDHCFGTRIDFRTPALAKISLKVGVIFGRGLVISWLDEQDLPRETLELSDETLKLLRNRLNAVAGL